MDKWYVQFLTDCYLFIYNSVIGLILIIIDITLYTYILDSCYNHCLEVILRLLFWDMLGASVIGIEAYRLGPL